MRIGKITENALKRSVLKQIRTEFKNVESAAVGTDCAFSNEKKVFSAVATVSEDIDDKGFYAAVKAANSLLAQGIIPDHIELGILLPADALEQELKTIVADAIKGCRICDTVYAGGHTEVSGVVNRSVVTAAAVGYRRNENMTLDRAARAGQSLLVTKWIALEGTAMLAAGRRDELISRYPVPFVDGAAAFRELLDIRPEAKELLGRSDCAVHDVSTGGILAALWEFAERAGCGLKVDLKKIPIRQESVELCEFFGLNPYMLKSGGALLISCDDAEGLKNNLMALGINAEIIGRLVEGNDRIIVNDEDESFLQLPQSDEILKILG